MRSFIVSLLVAIYLGYREFQQWRIRQREHSLDSFIERLMAIEQSQVSLGAGPNSSDASELKVFLDEVTSLRLEALRGWSAHDLGEDRAADCFLEMCHALSNKINAKLSRESMEHLSQLIETMLTKV